MNRDRIHQALFIAEMLIGMLNPSRYMCPICGTKGKTIAKKKALLELRRCTCCSLLFRVPTDKKNNYLKYYQKMYFEGSTTELPSEMDLLKLKETNFSSMQKDFDYWIQIMRQFSSHGKVLDYGCSWGYGAYQFSRAGYDTTGFEISRPRGQYGRDKLGVSVVFQEADLKDSTFDIVFSSHVIEHVENPNEMLRTIKRVLKPGGIFLGLCPNGSMSFRQSDLSGWMLAWGRKHPLFIDEVYLEKVLEGNPYLITSDLTVEKVEKWLSTNGHSVERLQDRQLVFMFKNSKI